MKKAVLLVSFGTSYIDAIENSLDKIAEALAEAADGLKVYQAYTSDMIIKKLSGEGRYVFTVEEAVTEAMAEEIHELYVIPSHMIPGIEYQKMISVVENYRSCFAEIKVASPVLDRTEDCGCVAEIMHDILQGIDGDYQQFVLMGHGTMDDANVRYQEMNEAFAKAGYDNITIASVEAKPDLEDAIAVMQDRNIKTVLLHPFMVVAGEHANHDMAGGDTDSYVSRLREAGYEVTTVVKGLGEYESFRRLYVEKLKELMA